MKYLDRYLTITVLFSCTGLNPLNSIDNDRLEEIDGNNYQIIRIGSQWWKSENLRASQFYNGDPLMAEPVGYILYTFLIHCLLQHTLGISLIIATFTIFFRTGMQLTMRGACTRKPGMLVQIKTLSSWRGGLSI